MSTSASAEGLDHAPVVIENRAGAGDILLLCEHASNYIPPSDDGLGLQQHDLVNHIAWDPGALGVAKELSGLLDAPLVHAAYSRLMIDCNRELDAPDLIPARSELTDIPGNQALTPEECKRRIELSHVPFHSAVEEVVAERLTSGKKPVLISIHSFTRTYKGMERPWEIGLIYDQDQRIARPVIDMLQTKTSYTVGDNEPYSPSDGVFYTLNRHAQSRGLGNLMIEIRNDEIRTAEQEAHWAGILAPMLKLAVEAFQEGAVNA